MREGNVVELRWKIWSASSVMMRIKAVTRLQNKKKGILSFNAKIKSLNSMTLSYEGGEMGWSIIKRLLQLVEN